MNARLMAWIGGWLMLAVCMPGCSGRAGPAANPNAAASGGPAAPPGPPGAPGAPGPPAPLVLTFEPVPWAVPPGGLPDGPKVADIVDVGNESPGRFVHLLPGCRDVYLTTQFYFDPKNAKGGLGPQRQLTLGKFDPATGKPVGEQIALGPEFLNGDDTAPMPVDISPSGILAMQNKGGTMPGTTARFWVLEPGATAPRCPEALPAYARWFAFGADNRLLFWNQGKLEAWDIHGTAPVYSVGEKLELPMVISPARNWVIATVNETYLEVFDAASGKTLGRFGGEGQWRFLNVSPDGKQLSGVRWAGHKVAPSSSPYQGRYDVHVWDLATGKQTSTIVNLNQTYGPPAWWVGPHHVYHDGKVWDLETRMAIVAIGLPMPPVGSPDGRMWFTHRSSGQAFAAETPLAPAGAKSAFGDKNPVKLEVAGPSAAEVKKAVTEGLTAGGYPIGQSQWTLKVKMEEKDTGSQVYDKQQTYNVPQVIGTWELIAPDRTTVATVDFAGTFSEDKSMYLVRTRRNDPLQPMTTIYEYDFRGKGARQAILEECWAKALEVLRERKQLGTVWEVNGKYSPLPVAIQFQPPPGVKPPDYNAR